MSTSGSGDWGAGAPSGSSGRVTSGAIPLAPVPATDVAAMTADQIMPLLHGLQPGAVTDAGQAHLRLGQNLAATADKLAAQGQTLSENWTGQSADTALAKLAQVHAQTLAMAQAATQAGHVLTWLGQSVLPSFKELPDPRGGLLNAGGSLVSGLEHAVDYVSGNVSAAAAAAASSAADTAARNYLTALNGYLVEASDNLPTTDGTPPFIGVLHPVIGASRAAPAGGSNGVTGGSVSGGGTGAGSAIGAGSPAGRLPAVVSGSGARSAGLSPGTPSAGMAPGSSSLPASLQSVPTPRGSLISVPPATPGGSSGAGGIGSGPGTAADAVPGAASVPRLDVPGVYPDPALPVASGGYGGPAAAGDGAAADGAGLVPGSYGTSAAGADASGVAGFPMTGAGAGGQQEKERQRQAWMYEDQDIWGGPTGCVPPVIEGTDWTWKRNQGR